MDRCIVKSVGFSYKERGTKPKDNRRVTSDDVLYTNDLENWTVKQGASTCSLYLIGEHASSLKFCRTNSSKQKSINEFKPFDYISENTILQIIRDKKLLDKKQSDNLKIIIEKEFIDNEVMIDIFYESEVLPLVGGNSYIKICNYSNAQEYITQGYFVYEDKIGNKITAINDLKLLFGKKSIFASLVLIKKYYFYKSLEENFAHLNSIKARYALEFKVGPIIAKNINYANKVIIFFILFMMVLVYLPVLFHIANNISYCIQNILKSVLFIKAIKACKPVEIEEGKCEVGELPVYTILVPLYKELSKLRSIIKNISLINYPKNKLDVKIIIEEDDYLMIKELALYNLPAYFHVIYVPKSFPRTKPKALNYALEYSRGEYIVVYDAEDKPEPDQLLKALAMFRNLPAEYICLQAKLNFYNKNENILTKMFNIEYSLWFEYILKGLSLLKLPMPLGGTSNHFKTNILRKLGGWDAYNVTEDAELGIRIYSQGYKVAILDSYTLEEAPNSLGNWLNQRSRWIKGFLQTFFVFQAQKDKYKKFTLLQIITIYIFIGLSTYNFWCLPFVVFSIVINKNSVINYLWLVNSIFSLLYLYGTALYILKNSLKSQKVKKNSEREAKRSTTSRHCEQLQGAWQSGRNNKKCYKLVFFNWVASLKLVIFYSNDRKTDPRNNVSTAVHTSENFRQDEFKVESAEELKTYKQRQEPQKSFAFRFMEYVLGKGLRSIQEIRYLKGLTFQDLTALILWGGYFILHTIASYKAVFEIIFCPFKWSKTKHGVSVEDFKDEQG